MKKLSLYFLFNAFVFLFICSGCSNRVFPVNTMEMNYSMKMNSKHDRETKSKVKIFYKETDVHGEYDVLSVNRYSPWFSIPIILPADKQIERKFLMNAVKTTYKQGGNGIIVTAPGFYKSIYIKSFDSDSERPSEEINIIKDITLQNTFLSGKLTNEKPVVIKQYLKLAEQEVDVNTKYANTIEEVEIIRNKIKVYEKFNESLRSPDKSFTESMENYSKKLNRIEKRMKKQATTQESNSATIKGDESKSMSEAIPVTDEQTQVVATHNIKEEETRPLRNKLPEKISPTYEIFRSGRIYGMSKSEKSNAEKLFITEIEADLENAKTMDDLDIIYMKIGYLEQYGSINPKVKPTVAKLKNTLNEKKNVFD